MPSSANYSQAVEDFHRARRRASIYRVLASWAGKSPDLLSYDAVREDLKATETPITERREIPLDSIVGSVGRYSDFTRGFLPRSPSDEGRWAQVKVAVSDPAGVPPIEVYQIGDAYFVLDGNHRVSVARDLGASHIEAYVRQVETRVPISPDDQPDDLIIKAEYADFLEQTALHKLAPDTGFEVTSPGRYTYLLQQIRAQQRHLESAEGREVSFAEAVEDWHSNTYQPTLDVIQERGLLRDFPGRTETDLYIWLTQNLEILEQDLGWQVEPDTAASVLAEDRSPRVSHRISRARRKLASTLTPEILDPGPTPGAWRRQHVEGEGGICFVKAILVPIGDNTLNRCALDQALLIAERENARLQGLHTLSAEGAEPGQKAQKLKAEFERRCAEAGIPGQLAIAEGNPAEQICARASWTDLVVLDLAYPPEENAVDRLTSGVRTIIQRSPTPVLTVPGSPSPLKHALLAYDGSVKSKEALYLSTYLSCRWGIALTIVSVQEPDRRPAETLLEAAVYVEDHGLTPNLVSKEGDVSQGILEAGLAHGCDFMVMGGYGHGPLMEAALGSRVNTILRAAEIPVLVCR